MLLPVHNGGATLARAIASIRAQRFSAWELLAVDDGSTDATAEILQETARADPRVRVLRRPREGLVAALNAGLAEARGEWIARMDADDVSHPERLVEQVALLRAQPEIGVASCLVEFGGDRAVNGGYALHVDWLNSLVTPEQIALNRFIEAPLAHPSALFRRALVERHGGYRAGDFPEDYELWLRWMAAGVRVAKVPRVLLTWHDRPERLSRTDARYGPEAFFRLKAEWIAREAKRLADRGGEGARRPIFVWGAGRPTRKRAAHLGAHGVSVAGYLDVDRKKTGRGIGGTGLPVLAPDEVPPAGEIVVLGYVASRGAREWVRTHLRSHGYREGRDFLMCA